MKKYFIYDHKDNGLLVKGGKVTTDDISDAHAYGITTATKYKKDARYEIVSIRDEERISDLLDNQQYFTGDVEELKEDCCKKWNWVNDIDFLVITAVLLGLIVFLIEKVS